MSRRLAWVLIAVLAAYVVFIGGGWLGIYEAVLRIPTMVFTALLLGGWGLVAWRDPSWRPQSVFLPVAILCLGSLALSTVFSRNPRVSVEYLGYAIVLAALYLLLVRLMASPFFRQRLVGLGAALFIVVVIEYAAFVGYRWINWWTSIGHLAVPPLRPNFEGLSWGNPSAVLTMITLLAVPFAAQTISWRPKGIAAFVGILLVIALTAVITASRAGMFALGVAAAVGAIAFLWSPERRAEVIGTARNVWRRAPLAGRVVVVVVVIGVFALGAAFTPSIVNRLGEGGESSRFAFFVVAIRQFLSSPLVGSGPGMWVVQRSAYTTADQTDEYIPHAHDVPAQTLAELGIVGAVVGVVLLVVIARLVLAAVRSTDPDRRKWGWLTGLMLVYFAAHNLLDFYLNMPAILLPAVLPVAWLDAMTPDDERVAWPMWRFPAVAGRLARAGGAAVIGVALVGLLVKEIPALDLDAAAAAANDNRWADAIAPAYAAADADPGIHPYLLAAGLAADHAGDHQKALGYFQQVAIGDDIPEAWIDLAAEQAAVGDRVNALTSIDRSLRLGQQFIEIRMAAGDLALRIGDPKRATAILGSAVAMAPTLAADPWWNADPTRAALYPQIIDAALSALGPQGGWPVALMADDPRVEGLATSAADQQLARAVVAAWAGDQSAARVLFQRCGSNPMDVTSILWCALVADRLGDDAAAGNYRSQAETIHGGAYASGFQVRVADRTGPIQWPEAGYIWPVYTYRVVGPYDMLASSLVHLRLQ